MTAILSAQYFPNIEYISKFLVFDKIIIEAHENYLKKTFRTRCDILSANGIITLSIPVIQNKNTKTLIKDIEISYAENWQKLHLSALESAYNSSPFFEFYIDDFKHFFNQKYTNLFEFNIEILKLILETIGIKTKIETTEKFIEINTVLNDFRFSISKTRNEEINTKYVQVFSEKFKFQPNLSILDVIFNLGPESILYLKNIIK